MTYQTLQNEYMAGPISFSYWFGEVKELIEEIVAANFQGIREEWSDVCCLGILLLLAPGFPVGQLPILPGLGLYAANKYVARIEIWKQIFLDNDVPFKVECLINGSNYNKPEKVRLALAIGKLYPQ